MSDHDAPENADKPARKPRKKPARKTPTAKAAKATAKSTRAGARQQPEAPAAPGADAGAPTAAGPGQPPATPPARQDERRLLLRVCMPVRWRDLDAFNHVNNSKYLSFLEEARLQWMLGVPGQGLDDHVAPVVASATLHYRRPITWPAQVAIELFVDRLGNTSLTVGHRIVAADDPQTLYCDGHVVMVWIDRDSGAAAALPGRVREACS